MTDLTINEHLTIPAAALTWSAVRASGPGGQNVNKVATKVELVFDPALVELPPGVLGRLRRRAGKRLDADGCVHIACQTTRSQSQNLELARERLADLVRAAWERPKPRKRTRPTLGSKLRRLGDKRAVGERKKLRGKRWDADS